MSDPESANFESDYTLWRDDLLIDMRDSLVRVLAGQEQAIIDTRKTIAAMTAELDRRTLEAFWQANPGLRLEVGDSVTVNRTFSFIDPQYKIGEILLIKDIDQLNSRIQLGEYYGETLGHVAFVEIEMAREMRQAYLELHPV